MRASGKELWKDMSKSEQHLGQCFCGKVEVRVTGQPVAAGYCHCSSCRQWSAAPINAFTLWAPEAVAITRGFEHVGSFSKTERSIRHWCTACGGHLFTEHPTWGVTDVYAALIPSFPFKAGVHVNYQETVLRLHDGLPKQKDMPAELGGTGTVVAA